MNINAFFLTLLAGFSSLIGYIFVCTKKINDKVIASTLGLSAGVMFSISILDLLPNSIYFFKLSFYSVFSYLFWILFFIIGVLLSLTLSDYIDRKNGNLYRVGIVSFVVLIIHNIPEGIITYLTTTIDIKMGLFLMISIAIHNIPEGISIAIPIYYASKSRMKTFIYVFISALAEPLGAFIAYIFLEDNLSNMIIALLYAIVAGIMISISLTELIPEGKEYSKKYTFLFGIIGIIIIYLSHLIYN